MDGYQGMIAHGDNDIHNPNLPQLAPPIPVDALLQHGTYAQPSVQLHHPPGGCG